METRQRRLPNRNSKYMTRTISPEDVRPLIATPCVCNGVVVRPEVMRKIRASLLSGEHPRLATIAKANGVTREFIQRMLNNDPELDSQYKTNLAITGEQIEKAAIDMCLDDELNPIARQKMMEFMLPKVMPDKYGETAGMNDAAKSLPKISISLNLPVVKEAPQIVAVETKSPLDGE